MQFALQSHNIFSWFENQHNFHFNQGFLLYNYSLHKIISYLSAFILVCSQKCSFLLLTLSLNDSNGLLNFPNVTKQIGTILRQFFLLLCVSPIIMYCSTKVMLKHLFQNYLKLLLLISKPRFGQSSCRNMDMKKWWNCIVFLLIFP